MKKKLRRAGMDYRDMAVIQEYQNLEECLSQFKSESVYALTTKGKTNYSSVKFQVNDVLLFGPETRGLPDDVLDQLAMKQKLRLPMLSESRSLNLSNTVAIVTYEALRQQQFIGME